MSKCLYVFLVLLIAPALNADTLDTGSANTEILIAAPSLSHLIERDGSGVYQKIFRRAIQKIPYTAKETFYPFRRALLEFEHNKVDCTYSYTEILEEVMGKSAIITSYPLGVFIFHAFTRKNASPINELSQLYNLTIGGINGQEQYYQSILSPELKYDLKLINTDKQGIEMLKLKRLDVFLAALPDVNPFLHELSYTKELVLYKSFDRITCHNTPKNQAFLKALSIQLQSMKEQGEYKSIAGVLYIDF